MNADRLGAAIGVIAAVVLGAAAAATVLAPSSARRWAVTLVPPLGRIGSSALRLILLVAGSIALILGAALLVRPVGPLAVAGSVTSLLAAGVVGRAVYRRSPANWRWHRRPVQRLIGALRRRPARRRALRSVREVVHVEVDPSIRMSVDLAWWAASATPGSVTDGPSRIDTHTVVVPGRHGHVTAVVPRTGMLSLLLVTSIGPVGGVSIRRGV